MENLPKEFSGDGNFVNHKCGIYAVVNPLGEIYIGQSINIPLRIRNYKKGRDASGRLGKSLFLHGRSSHKYYLVEKLPDDSSSAMLWDKEINYIDKFKKEGYTMLNCNKGGGGSGELRKKLGVRSVDAKFIYNLKQNI